MKMKKEYSKPKMVMETFTPQEYVAACWWLQLECTGGSTSGDHYLFNTPDPTSGNVAAVGEVNHGPHITDILKAHTPDDQPPQGQYLLDVLSSVGEFPASLADDSNTHGNPHGGRYWMTNKDGSYQVGYAWTYNGEYHFHVGEMVWQLQSSPNAS